MKEKILELLGILIGLSLCLWTIYIIASSKGILDLIFVFYFAMAVSGIAGVVFASILCPQISHYLWKNFYWASSDIKAPPPEFPLIRAKIAKGEYQHAEQELIELLKADNGNPNIIELLAELYIDKICDFRKAEGLLKAYLGKEERSPDDLKFVMSLVDVYLAEGKNDIALAFLRDELSKKYDHNSVKSIKKRIEGLKA